MSVTEAEITEAYQGRAEMEAEEKLHAKLWRSLVASAELKSTERERSTGIDRAMTEIVDAHGLTSPVLILAGRCGQRENWSNRERFERSQEAVRLLAKAGSILAALEMEEQRQRAK